ncbi:UNVERIFIED_CONTAM: hypothetical protein K2H54_025727, partial [Gekko kuhli]
KLYNSKGPELRRSLFSLKQLFQEDKDLVPEFVNLEGLTCLITVGAEADQNYQNYILRALGQIMLFVDGMMGVINHNQTVQWLYTLCGSLYRLVVKSALKLLLVFVEYTESNAQLLIQAVVAAEQVRGGFPWSQLVSILEQNSGADTELQVFAMTLVNKTLAALPDQDSFYDMTDCLEQQGMERIIQQHVSNKGTDPDLKQQFVVYENALKYEDGVEESPSGLRKERRKGEESRRGRRSMGYIMAQEESPGARGAEELQPSPAQDLGLDVKSNGQASFTSMYNSSSSVQLSTLSAPSEGEQAGNLGERSIFKLHETAPSWQKEPPAASADKPVLRHFEARFLENLAASQMEKLFAMSRGRAEVLAEAMPGAEQVSPGRCREGQNGTANGTEPVSALGSFDGERTGQSASDDGICSACPLGPEPVLSPGHRPVPPGEGTEASSAASEKKFMLDMLFSKTPTELERTLRTPAESRPAETWNKLSLEESGNCPGKGTESPSDLRARPLRAQFSIDAEANLQSLESTLMAPLRKDLEAMCQEFSPKLLKIRDLDFSDLGKEEDFDVLETEMMETVSPTGDSRHPAKKKTLKLFWRELKNVDSSPRRSRFGQATLWASLEKAEVDTAKLEHLFESKAKDVLPSKKAADGKKVIVVLDPKRSNAINIGLTVLPPAYIIKTAILNFDEFAITKEGIEKIMTMVPTEEEKQQIQEAQLANPDVPLGTAEQFLLTLSSISELDARLQLWAFKLDYESMEQEIAEPLFDLKLGMEQLARNQTFKHILATLLAMGNFLNGSQSRGFELSYLAKVSEVKDTVHRQTLLHHLCHNVVEKFPDTTDLYSEIAAITRSAKVDFDALAESLVQLEQRCKASWDSLKAIAKHEIKPALKSKLLDFLQASTQKIIILKIVHRRVLNRFRSFLLYLGYDAHSVRDVKVTGICQTLREFALEYRTCRERVLQQRKKRAAYRERNKTRGRMITEMERFASVSKPEASPVSAVLSASPEPKADEGHVTMTSVLISPAEPSGRRSRASRGVGKHTPPSALPPQDDAPGSPEDASEEIMDRLVKSVTQSTPPRPGAGKERKRSRVNRKSLRRTLKNGLSDELVQALGLAQSTGVAV